MQATIFKPCKTAMQSGTRNCKEWVLEYEPNAKRTIEPVMGWVSSSDTMREVKLRFDSKEEAIQFAENNDIKYHVIEPQEKKFITKSYAENFK